MEGDALRKDIVEACHRALCEEHFEEWVFLGSLIQGCT